MRTKKLTTRFRTWQRKHPNIMTPDIIRTKQRGQRIIEISKGRGMRNQNIYGVSVISRSGNGFKTTASKRWNRMFYSRTKAVKHANSVYKQFKRR